MKINVTGLEQYQRYAKPVKPGEGAVSAGIARTVGASNTDKVTISQSAAQRAEAGRLVPALSAEVESTAAPERVEALRQAVQDGSYHVSAGDVADAILDRLI